MLTKFLNYLKIMFANKNERNTITYAFGYGGGSGLGAPYHQPKKPIQDGEPFLKIYFIGENVVKKRTIHVSFSFIRLWKGPSLGSLALGWSPILLTHQSTWALERKNGLRSLWALEGPWLLGLYMLFTVKTRSQETHITLFKNISCLF